MRPSPAASIRLMLGITTMNSSSKARKCWVTNIPHIVVALAQELTRRAHMMLQGQLLSHSEWLSCLKIHKTQSAVVRLEEEDTRKSSSGEMVYYILGVTPAFCSEYIILSRTSLGPILLRRVKTENLMCPGEVSLLRLMPPTYACFIPWMVLMMPASHLSTLPMVLLLPSLFIFTNFPQHWLLLTYRPHVISNTY